MGKNNLFGRSSKAVCGISEREITVPISKHRSTIKQIRGQGYYVVGDDIVPGGRKRRTAKIWFTTGPGI